LLADLLSYSQKIDRLFLKSKRIFHANLVKDTSKNVSRSTTIDHKEQYHKHKK
jgi:hypothetical protein